MALVFDWGGGTFDVTVLVISYSQDKCPNIVVRSTGGLNDVGGADVDEALLEHLLEKIEEQYDDFDRGANSDFISKLRTKAITAKQQLSEYDSYELSIQLPKGKQIIIQIFGFFY